MLSLKVALFAALVAVVIADHAPVPSYGPAPVPVYAPAEPAYPDVSKFLDNLFSFQKIPMLYFKY
jgi:hypothetical protein